MPRKSKLDFFLQHWDADTFAGVLMQFNEQESPSDSHPDLQSDIKQVCAHMLQVRSDWTFLEDLGEAENKIALLEAICYLDSKELFECALPLVFQNADTFAASQEMIERHGIEWLRSV